MPPDVLAVITLLADGDADLTCEPRAPLRAAGKSSAGQEPENAFHRVENRQAMNLEVVRGTNVLESPAHVRPFRLLSIRAPRQAVLRTSSWLAPFCRHETLQPPGGKDARCVRPISATQTNCVHPHLACSRFLSPLSRRGRPTDSWAPYGTSGGRDVSRRP